MNEPTIEELDALDSLEFETLELSLADIELLADYHASADEFLFGEC